MFCPQCGAPNADDSTFCGNCGAVLNADELSVDVPQEEATDETLLLSERVEKPDAEPFDDLFPGETMISGEVPAAPVPAAPPRPAYVPQALQTSGMAIASLVLGIGGLTILPLIGSIAAIIFGYMARKDIRQRPGEVTGDGFALAGIIMGWIAVGLTLLGLLVGGGFLACGICGSIGAGNY